MNTAIPLTKDIHWVGAVDREATLFEAIWPLPTGMSFNAYLIDDEKVALIDTVKEAFAADIIGKVRSLIGTERQVDYLVINHIEPDHSGALRSLCNVFPDMQIIGNKKTSDFVGAFYDLADRCHIVEDGDTLSLGTHALSFHVAPMVHWPETMVSYEKTTGILFSGDVFGAFGALAGGLFDDEVQLDQWEHEHLRYFSNIIGKYCPMVQKALATIGGLDVSMGASTHGPIFRHNPQWIIERTDRWSRQETRPGLVVAYASMYGNTKHFAQATARTAVEAGLNDVQLFDVSHTHPSFIIADTWIRRGLLLASCTFNATLFPTMELLVSLLKNKGLKDRVVGYFGTYSWASAAHRHLKSFAESRGFTVVEPSPEIRAGGTDEDLDTCRQLGRNLAQAIGEK